MRGTRVIELHKPLVVGALRIHVSEAVEVRRLVELRDGWLNPRECVERVGEPVLDYTKRPVLREEDTAKALKQRTLTNLYSARPIGARGDGQ